MPPTKAPASLAFAGVTVVIEADATSPVTRKTARCDVLQCVFMVFDTPSKCCMFRTRLLTAIRDALVHLIAIRNNGLESVFFCPKHVDGQIGIIEHALILGMRATDPMR